jgi:hypothetical protein
MDVLQSKTTVDLKKRDHTVLRSNLFASIPTGHNATKEKPHSFYDIFITEKKTQSPNYIINLLATDFFFFKF